eukprot:gnl/TRDRNA2_/TRDRNA2_192993_c0_seq1.p1 gnl/TRDRNA2_/TRDRNA2_192993_c0~~gnl/TRDRNA2_/TRDRNA2_192993_c0_seq1.p1  ORF type:complete len:443 (-),score=72.15 gnl/TRDRNA2_/TRDRNA2_192993_c0_seq1:122-1393(-)
MAQTGPIFSGPLHNMTVRARRRLNTNQAADSFNEELLKKIEAAGAQNKMASFEDFDIAQNKIPSEQFETLFATLGTGVKVERMRLFGCPTLNDEVMNLVAGWLSQVDTEKMPFELHLSDCAITGDGFEALMQAIENNDCFPSTRNNRTSPLYIRLENNYIAPDLIKAKVDSGVVYPFKKGDHIPPDCQAKVKLVVATDNGRFGQRDGEPPAPENAPPPKQVNDPLHIQQQGWAGQALAWRPPASQGAWNSNWQQSWPATSAQQSWGGQQSWGAQATGWGATQAARPQAATNAWGAPRPVGPAAANMARPAGQAFGQAQGFGAVRPQMQAAASFGAAKGAGKQGTYNAPQAQVVRPQGKGAFSGGWNVAAAADRSRTPPPRPAAPPPPKNGLPPPWEEHWSDEYGIPYYWNPTNGESLWEKPTA